MTKHSVDAIFYVTPTPVTDNFLRNAGFEGGPAGPWTVTNVVQAVFGSWFALNGAGSSAALSRELTIKSSDSDVAAKIIQTKVAGALTLYQNYSVPSSMRSKQVTISVQVQQSVANAVRLYIGDNIGTTFGSSSATTGSMVTLTATRTIDGTATLVQAGLSVDVSATVYADNAILSLGAVAATYRPEYFSARTLTEDLLADLSVSTRTLQTGAVTDAAMASQKVNRTGDTMTGQLNAYDRVVLVANPASSPAGGILQIKEVAASGGDWLLEAINSAFVIARAGSGTFFQLSSAGAISAPSAAFTGAITSASITVSGAVSGATASFSGLVSAGSIAASGALSGSTVTGSVAVSAPTLVSTIATGNPPMQAASTTKVTNLNADRLDDQEGTFYQSRANHTSTQLAATISDLAAAVAGMAAASAATATTAATATNANALGGVAPSGYGRMVAGTYVGNNGSSRQITTGFVCKYVVITLSVGGTYGVWNLLSATPSQNVQVAGSSSVSIQSPINTALHGSDGFIVDQAADITNANATTYRYVAYG